MAISGFLILHDTGKLRIEYQLEGTVLKLRPVGLIDEDVNFSVVLDLLSDLKGAAKMIQFDLGHVTALNSCGVREWLLFMERLNGVINCAFINVTEVFIDQANMITNLFGRSANPILSFHAPYHCPQCNSETTML